MEFHADSKFKVRKLVTKRTASQMYSAGRHPRIIYSSSNREVQSRSSVTNSHAYMLQQATFCSLRCEQRWQRMESQGTRRCAYETQRPLSGALSSRGARMRLESLSTFLRTVKPSTSRQAVLLFTAEQSYQPL